MSSQYSDSSTPDRGRLPHHREVPFQPPDPSTPAGEKILHRLREHYWTSSDPHIATVDPVTGQVTAHHTGSVTITCTSDMVSGNVTLTVQ